MAANASPPMATEWDRSLNALPESAARALPVPGRDGRRRFVCEDLSGREFVDLNLSGADFIDCRIAGTRFVDVDLRDVCFENTSLENAEFVRCAFSGTLERVQSTEVRWTRCTFEDLRWIDGEGTDDRFEECRFRDVRVRSCVWSRARFSHNDFRNVRWDDCAFQVVTWDANRFAGVRLRLCRFPELKVAGNRFDDAVFQSPIRLLVAATEEMAGAGARFRHSFFGLYLRLRKVLTASRVARAALAAIVVGMAVFGGHVTVSPTRWQYDRLHRHAREAFNHQDFAETDRLTGAILSRFPDDGAKYGGAAVLMGRSAIAQGRLADAERWLKEGYDRSRPGTYDSLDAQEALARLYDSIGPPEEAERWARRLTEDVRHYEIGGPGYLLSARRVLGKVYARPESYERETGLLAAETRSENPEEAFAAFQLLVEIERNRERFEEMADAADAVADRFPVEADRVRSEAYLQLGRYDEAYAALGRLYAREYDPAEQARLRVAMIDALVGARRIDEAERLFPSVATLFDGGIPESLQRLVFAPPNDGYSALPSRTMERLLEYIARMLERRRATGNPHYADILDRLLTLKIQAEDNDAVLAIADKIVGLAGATPEARRRALETRAGVHQLKGRSADALKDYEAMLALSDDPRTLAESRIKVMGACVALSNGPRIVELARALTAAPPDAKTVPMNVRSLADVPVSEPEGALVRDLSLRYLDAVIGVLETEAGPGEDLRVDAMIAAARVAEWDGRADAAERRARRVIDETAERGSALSSQRTEAMNILGRVLIAAERYDEAVAVFTPLLDSSDRDTAQIAFSRIVELKMQDGDEEGLFALTERMRDRFPVLAVRTRADLLYRMREFARAYRELGDLRKLEADPMENMRVRIRMTDCLLAMGRVDEAESLFAEVAADIDQDVPDNLYVLTAPSAPDLSGAEKSATYARFIEYVAEVLERADKTREPRYFDLLDRLLGIYAEAQDDDAVVRTAEKIIRNDAVSTAMRMRAYETRAGVLMVRGRVAESQADYEAMRALADTPALRAESQIKAMQSYVPTEDWARILALAEEMSTWPAERGVPYNWKELWEMPAPDAVRPAFRAAARAYLAGLFEANDMTPDLDGWAETAAPAGDGPP